MRRLARGLLDALDMIPAEDRRQLTDDAVLEPAETAHLVHRLAHAAVQDARFNGIDIDLIRGVLFTLANDVRMHALALTWLRCEDLCRYDRELLGDLVPRPQPEMPVRTLVGLGRLMYAVHAAALVLLVDQIDQVVDLDRPGEQQGDQLRFAVAALLDVADKLPNAVVVIGCIEDLYTLHGQRLPRWALDRLERDPAPLRLSGKPNPDAVAKVLARRLEVFFESVGVKTDPGNPTAPYAPGDLDRLSGLQMREVLGRCLEHRRRCIDRGWLPALPVERGRGGARGAAGGLGAALERVPQVLPRPRPHGRAGAGRPARVRHPHGLGRDARGRPLRGRPGRAGRAGRDPDRERGGQAVGRRV